MIQRKLSLLLVLSVLPLFPSLGEEKPSKPVHLFILSGQSNMAGMKPETGFVPETEALFPDAEVAFIKVSRGGQPIRLWVEEWGDIAAEHEIDAKVVAAAKEKGTVYYKPIMDQFGALLKKYPDPTSVTFCWMQGERDAKEGLSAAYADSMKKLISNLRRDLNQPKMYFVIGRLSDFGKPDNKHWQAVRDAQVSVAEEDPLGAWVDCDDLNDMEKNGKMTDDLHYTKEGYALLGRRYARQAKAMIEGGEPAANGRPE